MDTLPPYEDALYYVWGLHGVLIIDAISHTEALEFYRHHFAPEPTIVEHVMLVPNVEDWAERPPDPEVDPHHDGCDPETCDCDCAECRIECTYFPTTSVEPDDPRVSWIDLESEIAAHDARVDQTIARSREHGGYFHGEEVDMSQGPDDPTAQG